jgi:hypothetical protein
VGSDARCDFNGTLASTAAALQEHALEAAPIRIGSLAS